MKDILPEMYEQIKTSKYPVFIWGTGILGGKVEKRLEEQGITVEGFFVDAAYYNERITESGKKVYTFDEIQKNHSRIDVVMGHGHYEKGAELSELPWVHHVYFIANPYIQYCSPGIGAWIQENRTLYDTLMGKLADDASRDALSAYCKVNQSNDIHDVLNHIQIIDDIFDFDGLHLTKEERYLDAGAWEGNTIKLFCSKTDSQYQHIYAVEPARDSFRRLEETVAAYDHVTLYSCGLGAKEGKMYLSGDEESSQSASLVKNKTGENQVCIEVTTIDELFRNKPLSLINLNIPFVFSDILAGAREHLLMHKPRLIINATISGGTELFDVLQWIFDLNAGYRVALRYDMPIPVRLWIYAY